MDKIYTVATIKQKDKFGFVYRIGQISYTEYRDGKFVYTITPNYSVIDLLPDDEFQGIPGLDLDTRKTKFERVNKVPVFIEERTPSEGREDLWDLLAENGMDYLNRLEWLIRTNKKYSGDHLYVESYDELHDNGAVFDCDGALKNSKRSVAALRSLLKEICYGNTIYQNGKCIVNDDNRKIMYNLFMSLYQTERKHIQNTQKAGITKAKGEGKYQGRKSIKIDDARFNDLVHMFMTDQLSEAEVCAKLGISRSSFYRRLRQHGIPPKRYAKENHNSCDESASFV